MVIRKEARGVVEYNDGEFAEVQTVGTEGIEKNLLLCKIQLHREDTDDSRQEFQHKYPVDTCLHISMTIQIRTQLKTSSETR